MWDWLLSHSDFLAILLALSTLIWSAYQYFSIKRSEERKRRFETYHELIRQLVEKDEDKPKMLDRQLAVVFELRNFLEYSEPSIRILAGLRRNWEGTYGPSHKNDRLMDQLDSTIYYLKLRLKEVLWPPN